MNHSAGTSWVWDASPLVHAVRAGRLDMLYDLARRQASHHLLTTAVADDLLRQQVLSEVVALGWPTRVKEPDDPEYEQELVGFQELLGTSGTLHLGEATVMALARRLPGVAVLDDRNARQVARRRDVAQIGILGVLDDAARMGHHTMVSASVFAQDLAQSGGWYPQQAIDDFPEWSRRRRRALGLSPIT